jgi:hypothetical protein
MIGGRSGVGGVVDDDVVVENMVCPLKNKQG